MSSLNEKFSYLAYPNTRPSVIGDRGFTVHSRDTNLISDFVISKFSIYAAKADEDENHQLINSRASVSYGIQGTRDGRTIANFITDNHPAYSSGACPDGNRQL